MLTASVHQCLSMFLCPHPLPTSVSLSVQIRESTNSFHMGCTGETGDVNYHERSNLRRTARKRVDHLLH